MSKQFIKSLILCHLILIPAMAYAQKDYAPGKVLYDVTSSDTTELAHIIDRASLLQNIYQHDSFDASIILVVHEGAIPFFVKHNKIHHKLMQRMKSLALGGIIQIRVCETSAKMQGLYNDDFDDFIQLVPMADAEMIELQNDGYAYLK